MMEKSDFLYRVHIIAIFPYGISYDVDEALW